MLVGQRLQAVDHVCGESDQVHALPGPGPVLEFGGEQQVVDHIAEDLGVVDEPFDLGQRSWGRDRPRCRCRSWVRSSSTLSGVRSSWLASVTNRRCRASACPSDRSLD